VKFSVESGRWIFSGEVGGLLFAIENKGKEDEEPKDAEGDDKGAVAAEFGGWGVFQLTWFWEGVERMPGRDREGVVETGEGSFGIDVAEEIGELVGAGIKAVDFEIIAMSFGGGFVFNNADDQRGLVVFAWDDFDRGTRDIEIGDGGGEAERRAGLCGSADQREEEEKRESGHRERRLRD
jgi:hypothetical protein